MFKSILFIAKQSLFSITLLWSGYSTQRCWIRWEFICVLQHVSTQINMHAYTSTNVALHLLITPDNDDAIPPTLSSNQYIITMTISIIRVVLEMRIRSAKHSSERDIKVRKREKWRIKQLKRRLHGVFSKRFSIVL